MRAIQIIKKIEYDVGWLAPEFIKHDVGDILIPSENLYLSADKRVYNIDKVTSRDTMPSANTNEKINFENGEEAANHILKIGKWIHADTPFYREIEIDDDKIKQILENQKTTASLPQRLTELVNEVLVSA